MEVILKRTKITTSILKQTLGSSISDLETSEVLGWCIFAKAKHIVIFHPATNKLSKFLTSTKISRETKNNGGSDFFRVKIHRGSYIPLLYDFLTEKEADEFAKTIEKVESEAKSKGQFFL